MFVAMRAQLIYRQLLQSLQEIYSKNEAAVITDWVVEKLAGISKKDFIREPLLEISAAATTGLQNALLQLLQHKPVQYVLGEAWFGPLKLVVNEHVLIPRPETEELVQWILADPLVLKKELTILDIGTGSGCIPIYLKKKLTNSQISAADITEEALSIAKQNAAFNDTAINFIKNDFLTEKMWHQLPVVDIIVSNPPYIPARERMKMDQNVTDYEPHNALFVSDDDPLIFYKKIALFATSHLKKEGKVFVEIHEDFAEATAALFEKYFTEITVKKDLFGKERMISATQFR